MHDASLGAWGTARLDPDQLRPACAPCSAIVVAAAFHDIGIWTDATFDYIEPSVARAVAHLGARGQADLAGAVTAMIRHHHQLRRYRGAHAALTEPFRRADAIDVSCGLLRHGVDRGTIAEAYRRWPGAGFHRFLVGQAMRRLRTHPLSPLPMLRW